MQEVMMFMGERIEAGVAGGRWRWLGWLLALALQVAYHGAGAWAQTPRINELQSANDHTLLDEDGDSSDWIELWNPDSRSFQLGGCSLSDSARAPFKWVFATNTVLAPGEFLVVYASGKDRQPDLLPALAPTGVPGLRVWLRADAVNPSNPAEVRVAGNGVFLRRWKDLSGSGNHADQPSEGQQPQWVSGVQGGGYALRFDGVDDLLRLPRPAATNDFCLFAVCRTSQLHEADAESAAGVGGVSGQRWLFGATHGGNLDGGAGVSIGTNGIGVYEHGSGYMPALLSYQRPMGASLQILAVNYALRQPALDSQGLAVRTGLTSPRRQVWAPVEIGAGAYGAFAGDLAEVLVYDRALTADQRRSIARYLAERYSVAMPLPRHTSFQLSADGEQVLLTRPDGVLLDAVGFGPVPRDLSYGRSLADPSQWHFFAAPTPGASNTTPGSTEWLFPPAFSHEGGFYSNAFDLTLSSTNVDAQVRYTLNGAEPTTNSLLYSSPIRIRSRTGTANDLSAIPTVPGGQLPSGEVFKGWAVRARVFKAGAMPSPVITRTFWVHPKGASRYTLPVVALTTERRNFFDPDIGIYIPGNAPGGNYSQRGLEWERPVFVEFFETNRLAFAQEGDVKIHGNTSQNFPIKGLDLDATGGLGTKPFEYAFFPGRNRSRFEHILLRPSGHDHYMAFMRDELMQELGAETGAESQAARPCVVFLNGEYWGLHYLKEKEDAEFVGFYGDVPVDRLDYLEGYAVAKAGDTQHYDAMVQFAASHDLALNEAYEQVQALMDVPNYIDYKVCEIFNYRWDIGNHRLWRPRTPQGRWRWLQFDNDVGWGGFAAVQPGWSYDMLMANLTTDGRLNGHNNEATTFLLRRLMPNSQFQGDFLNRFADLLNTTLLPANTLSRVDRLAAQLAPEMAEHCQRWRAPASLNDWLSAVNYLREFARRRPDFCRQHLLKDLKLGGVVQLSLAVSPLGAGSLRLNSLRLSPSALVPWNGAYFRGNPVHLVAEAEAGYVFAGWTGLGGVTTNDVRVMLQGDWAVAARFEPSANPPPRLQAVWVSPGRLKLAVFAAPNSAWTVQVSEGLRSWSAVGEVATDSAGTADTEVAVGSARSQFFRLRSP